MGLKQENAKRIKIGKNLLSNKYGQNNEIPPGSVENKTAFSNGNKEFSIGE